MVIETFLSNGFSVVISLALAFSLPIIPFYFFLLPYLLRYWVFSLNTHSHILLLSHTLGEYSYIGTTLRNANIEPMPSLSDIRRVVSEYCILPLGKYYSLLVKHNDYDMPHEY